MTKAIKVGNMPNAIKTTVGNISSNIGNSINRVMPVVRKESLRFLGEFFCGAFMDHLCKN